MSPGIPASPNAVAIAATRDPARSWKPVLQVLAPWLLLEALVAVAFMSAHLAMAIETSDHMIDLETCAFGLACGAMVGGTTLSIAAFTVAGVAALGDLVRRFHPFG